MSATIGKCVCQIPIKVLQVTIYQSSEGRDVLHARVCLKDHLVLLSHSKAEGRLIHLVPA